MPKIIRKEQPVEQPKEVKDVAAKSVWDLIKEAEEETLQLKKASEVNELEKTSKCYDATIKKLGQVKKSIERIDKVKTKEEENKGKPKRERHEPYLERFVETLEINGKLKDKYEYQKTDKSPIIVKYKAHKPVGLTEDQKEYIKNTLNTMKEKIEWMNSDHTEQQYRVFVNDCLYDKVKEEPQAEEALTSEEELALNF